MPKSKKSALNKYKYEFTKMSTWEAICHWFWCLRFRWPMKKLYRLWYWMRARFIYRYHLVDMRNPPNDYHWGYIDPCAALFYASFAILKGYVEKEDPFNHLDWNWDKKHAAAGKEIKALYVWWTKGRKKAVDALDKLSEKNYPKYVKQVDRLEEKDDEMLLRLMKVRKFLWT